jgi:ribonuclease P/MRP protein subunit POP1
MKMVNVWGHRIVSPDSFYPTLILSKAYNPNDKGVRAIYRFTAHQCTLYDISYYGCIEVSGPQSSLLNMMRLMTDPTASTIGNYMCVSLFTCSSNDVRFLDGAREGQCMLYKPKLYPLGAICPIRFLWNSDQADTKRILWMWIHPAALDEALSSIQSVAGEFMEGK